MIELFYTAAVVLYLALAWHSTEYFFIQHLHTAQEAGIHNEFTESPRLSTFVMLIISLLTVLPVYGAMLINSAFSPTLHAAMGRQIMKENPDLN